MNGTSLVIQGWQKSTPLHIFANISANGKTFEIEFCRLKGHSYIYI